MLVEGVYIHRWSAISFYMQYLKVNNKHCDTHQPFAIPPKINVDRHDIWTMLFVLPTTDEKLIYHRV